MNVSWISVNATYLMHYENTMNPLMILWNTCEKTLWKRCEFSIQCIYGYIYVCVRVCVCVCVHVCVCVRTYNHIKISYTEICTDKNYIYITKFQRYILIYHINMVPVITLMKLSLYKDCIVWILYESYIYVIYNWYGKFKGSWFTPQL